MIKGLQLLVLSVSSFCLFGIELRAQNLLEFVGESKPQSQREGILSSFIRPKKFASCLPPSLPTTQILVRPKSIESLRASGMSENKIDRERQRASLILKTLPIESVGMISALDLHVLQIPTEQNADELISRLEQTGLYESIRQNCLFPPAITPDDPLFSSDQVSYLGPLDFENAWDITTGDESVTIAILDTGVQSTHSEFAGRLVPGYNAASCASTAAPGCGSTEPVSLVNPCGAHGTMVAGAAAATGDNNAGIAGINWEADIMPIRITDDSATCLASTSDMISAIIWASEHGADVINLSYSGAFDPDIQDAAEVARENGALLVMAAGNDSEDLGPLCLGLATSEYCQGQDMIIVGSTDGGTTSASLSAFSNFGGLVDLVAPGENISTTTVGNAYTSVSGTSLAAPIVAGLASLLLSVDSSLSPQDITQILLETADDMGSAGEDNFFGSGLIDADEALNTALTRSSSLYLADNRKLDFSLPRKPFKFWRPEFRSSGNPHQRIFAATSQNQGLISMSAKDLGRRDLHLAELPAEVAIGYASLFYRTHDGSHDFIFTDNGRKYVYYGTTNASGSNSGEPPVVRTLSCGPFSEISAIHLTESSGNTHRLIVTDRQANRIYSYILNPAGPDLCTSETSVSFTAPSFIKSLPGAAPRIFVGGSDSDGLRLRLFNAATLAPLAASMTISDESKARFGSPMIDTDTRQLILPVQFADHPTLGSHFLRVFDEDMAVVTSLSTCIGPVEIQQDFEGINRYRYVFCPISRSVNVYDLNWNLISRLNAPQGFKRMAIYSNGVTRYLAMLGSTKFLTLFTNTLAATPISFQESSLEMTSVMDDMTSLPSQDGVVTLNKERNEISHIDLSPLATSDTFRLPSSITDLVSTSPKRSFFVSSGADTAYSIEELFNGAWKMRLFDVGDHPTQILFRPGRLYTLNKDSDSVSIINLTSRAVSSLSTQDRPVSMALDLALNRLWTANQLGDSWTTLNITPGSEALIGHSALTFGPEKVLYDSDDDTLYLAGESSARSVDGSSNVGIATQSLSGTFSDMALISGGAWITSQEAITVDYMTRTTRTSTALSSSPQLLSSNGAIGVLGQLNDSQILSSTSITQEVDPFTHLFSTPTNLFLINSLTPSLRIFPFGNLTSSEPSGIQKTLLINPEKFSSDSLGNVWLADSRRLQLQRIDANYQIESLQNLTLNRPSDLVSWSARDRQYFLLRNLGAIMVWDTLNNRRSFFATCSAGKKIVLDTQNENLFVLCGTLNNIAQFQLKPNGDILSQSLIATQSRPFDMILDTARDRLFVSQRAHNSVALFDSSNMSAAPTTIATSNDPTALALNATNGNVYVFHAGPREYRTINGTTLAASSTQMVLNNISSAVFNPTSSQVYALNESSGAIHYDASALQFVPSGLNFLDPSMATDIAVSSTQSKVYVAYPNQNTLRIYAESGTITDLNLGAQPSKILAVDSLNRGYISNFADDTISVVNLTTNAVLSTISLTPGCGPRKMAQIDISGVSYISVLCESNDSVERFNATSYALSTALDLRVPD